jgi:hypothetical protein
MEAGQTEGQPQEDKPSSWTMAVPSMRTIWNWLRPTTSSAPQEDIHNPLAGSTCPICFDFYAPEDLAPHPALGGTAAPDLPPACPHRLCLACAKGE